jgi:catechol 2,3-dioxygenase-like lactoylglutathione lyase family enzyme
MIRAKRIGHATFETPDIEAQIEYYQQVVGLTLAHREPGRAFLATSVGQLSIVLEKSSASRCSRLSFEVGAELDGAEMSRRLAALGLQSEKCSDALPGISRSLTFRDCKDTIIELFSDWSFLDVAEPAGGVAPFKLGHVAFFVRNPQEVSRFYEQVLGFRVSDWIGDYFAFLRCGVDHHTVNFLRGDTPGIQHIAFELRDTAHMLAACDLLARKRIKILWGPVRHGPGHNIATYHRNPDGQLVEFFIDLDRMVDEELGYFEPRPWHKDRPQKPKIWDPAQPRDIWGLPPTPEFLQRVP